MTIGTVTGATYSGGFLNFASTSGTATIQATSASVRTAQLQVIYAESGYWNASNVKVYHPCDNGDAEPRQDFVGVSQGNVVYPHRETSATWTAPSPLACTGGYYFLDNGTSLYKITSGDTRTFITSVSGDLNAMGYSSVDNFLWGYNRATNQVFKLGSDGAEFFTIPGMPAPASSTSTTVGTVDLNGHLFLYQPNATQYLTIDINPARSTYLQLVDPTNAYAAKTGAPWGTATTARNISDWVYNPATGLIHGVINGAGPDAYYVSQLNPVTGVSTLSATAVSGGGITSAPTSETMDSQFLNSNGNLMVYLSAFWYEINLSTNIATRVSTTKAPISFGNDGASCVQGNTPLPVTLANFTATAENTTVSLNWVTSTEINNSGFEIERSANVNQWKSLGFVKSNAVSGNTQQKQSYRFIDSAPLDGTNYYRLKQIDLDGNYTYGPVRSVAIENADTRISVYPNPVKDQLTVRGLTGLESIQVQDLSGRNVVQSRNEAGQSEKVLPVKSLVNGMYIITVHTPDGKSVSHKIVKTN